MTQDYDPGSICDECPHPLDEHDVTITLDAGVVMTCDDETCDCRQTWAYRRPLETPPFNQEATKALGSLPGRQTNQGDQHG